MRIGVLVDGESEYYSLSHMLTRVATTRHRMTVVVARAPIPPTAPYAVIAQVCAPRVDLLVEQGADKVLVILDQEARDECPSAISSSLETSIKAVSQRLDDKSLYVVVKHRRYENWLIADLEALAAQRGRFKVPRAVERAVRPDKADNVDGLEIIKRCVVGDYDKVRDSIRIMKRANPLLVANNSRSFRRLLRVYGSPDYHDQSRRPARSAPGP